LDSGSPILSISNKGDKMPKPYHTPKSERDEALGALAEAEAEAEIIRCTFCGEADRSKGEHGKGRCVALW
jgi:hypothetical protein